MVYITRNIDKEQFVWSKTKEHITGDSNRNEDGGQIKVHGSDLLWCIRQAWYKKFMVRQLSPFEILKFFEGKISEYAIGRFIYTDDHYLQQERIEQHDIVAHPDILSHVEDMIVELKQTGKEFGFVDPRDVMYNSFKSYATQTLYYMLLANKTNGNVVVNHTQLKKILKLLNKYQIPEKDMNPFRVWDIKIENLEDYRKIERDLKFKRQLLEEAIKIKDVAFLPKLATINPDDTNKCNICPYKEQCEGDKDYWQQLDNVKILRKRAQTFGMDENSLVIEHINENFIRFEELYGEEDVKKVDPSYLYNSMLEDGYINYGDLGEHYKVEFGSKKKAAA